MTPLMVDSSTFIDYLRAGRDIRGMLLSYAWAGELYNCGVVRAEVLRGMKSPKALDGMEQFFDILPEVPTDAKLWREVSAIGWRLGREGKWPPVTDLVIAASALRIHATLVTRDAHFEDVPGLKLLGDLPGA